MAFKKDLNLKEGNNIVIKYRNQKGEAVVTLFVYAREEKLIIEGPSFAGRCEIHSVSEEKGWRQGY